MIVLLYLSSHNPSNASVLLRITLDYASDSYSNTIIEYFKVSQTIVLYPKLAIWIILMSQPKS